MACCVLAAGCVLDWDRTWDQGATADLAADAKRDGKAPDGRGDRGADAVVTPSGWATSLGATVTAIGYDVAVDTSNNVFVTGSFREELRSGAIKLKTRGKLDIFVAKLSSVGKVQWIVSGGGSDDDRGSAVVVAPEGGVYVSGFFVGSLTLGGKKHSGVGRDLFLARILADGTVDWVKTYGGAGWDSCEAMALDKPGDTLWLSGKFNGTINLGGKKLTSTGPKFDLYVARFSAKDGTIQKALRAGGPGYDVPTAVKLDGSGGAYLSGYFDGASLTVGTTTLTGKGGFDIFVARVLTSGDGFQ